MATQSQWKLELKQLLGEMSPGPKIEVSSDHDKVRGGGDPDPQAPVPRALSDLSGSGGGAPRTATAGSLSPVASGAISVTGDDPGQPFLDCVPAKGLSDVQSTQNYHTYPICVVLKKGQSEQTTPEGNAVAMEQATNGSSSVSGWKSQTPGPGNGRRKKQPSRSETAQTQKPAKRLLIDEVPELQTCSPLPPSSPTYRPSRGSHFWSSPGCQAARPGPALRSHTNTPAICPEAPEPGPEARCLRSRRGPAVCSRAPEPGPETYRRVCRRGPVVCRRAPEPGHERRRRRRRRRAPHLSPAFQRSAPDPGPDDGLPAPQPGPDGSLEAPEPGPERRRRRRCATEPSLDGLQRQRASGSPASGSSPTLRSGGDIHEGPALQSCSTTPGFVFRSRPTQRRSGPVHRPCLFGVGAPGSHPSPGSALRRLVFESSSSSSDAEGPSGSPQRVWHAVRMRASSPSPPGRLFPYQMKAGEERVSSSSSSSSSAPSSPQSAASHSPLSSGQSTTSSPVCQVLASISTPSPSSLRRALLPDLEVLSPLSSDEPDELEEIGSTPTPPPQCSAAMPDP
ncbi:PREDICTED: uncharacterized protein CXorf67 homolog [Condylura cristata]|uniref:uncharacterized protein CXorf67 homolog n=1 Tax=Condylura cristata TaxID=143302 RepID=UPI00064345ED|nr:PREDICTED: uncharacterized protein CXorf67 homolog [Condylura cristata]